MIARRVKTMFLTSTISNSLYGPSDIFNPHERSQELVRMYTYDYFPNTLYHAA